MSQVHDFKEDHAESEAMARLPFWGKVFSQIYPNHTAWEYITDPRVQQAGADYRFTLPTGTALLEVKVRKTFYRELALETVSVNDGKIATPGWAVKQLVCDKLAYVYPARGFGFAWDWAEFSKAFQTHWEEWDAKFPTKPAKNNGYQSYNLMVPREVLDKVCRIQYLEFDPYDLDQRTVPLQKAAP